MGEGHQAALGRRIGLAVRLGLVRARRGDVDHRAATVAARQRGQRVLAAQERAMQAGQAPVPFREVQARQRRDHRVDDAGVVDQAVDAAEAGQRGVDKGGHAAFAHDVHAAEQRVIADGPLRQAGAAGIRIEIADGDAAARAQHRLRDRAADALRAAGHQHHAAVERPWWPGFGIGYDRHRCSSTSGGQHRRRPAKPPCRRLRATDPGGAADPVSAVRRRVRACRPACRGCARRRWRRTPAAGGARRGPGVRRATGAGGG